MLKVLTKIEITCVLCNSVKEAKETIIIIIIILIDLVINDLLLAVLRESVALCSVLTHFLSTPRYLSSCLINFLQRSTELLGACKRGFHSKLMKWARIGSILSIFMRRIRLFLDLSR